MATIKLGKMERDYSKTGYNVPSGESKPGKDEPQIEVFPTIYIRNDDIPELKVGQEVILKGVVVEYGSKERKVKEDGETEIETCRNADIEVHSMEVKGLPPKEAKRDEDAVDEGLSEAEKPKEDEDEEE